jgi:hypothetical protein
MFVMKTHCDDAVLLHDCNLDVLCARLNNLEQTLHSKFDSLIPSELVLVVFLQKLPYSL